MKIAITRNIDVHGFIRRNVLEIKLMIEIDVYRQSKNNKKIFNDFQNNFNRFFIMVVSLGKNSVIIHLNALIQLCSDEHLR